MYEKLDQDLKNIVSPGLAANTGAKSKHCAISKTSPKSSRSQTELRMSTNDKHKPKKS